MTHWSELFTNDRFGWSLMDLFLSTLKDRLKPAAPAGRLCGATWGEANRRTGSEGGFQSSILSFKVAQLCATVCDPIDCSAPGSSVHGVLLARILEWVAIPFSRRSSWSGDWTQGKRKDNVPCMGHWSKLFLQTDSLPSELPGKHPTTFYWPQILYAWVVPLLNGNNSTILVLFWDERKYDG